MAACVGYYGGKTPNKCNFFVVVVVSVKKKKTTECKKENGKQKEAQTESITHTHTHTHRWMRIFFYNFSMCVFLFAMLPSFTLRNNSNCLQQQQ